MNTKGRIIDGGEITQEGYFSRNNERFFIFLMPKGSQYDNTVSMTVQMKVNTNIDFPMSVCVWNPVALRGVTISKDILSKYRVFWGAEGC